MSCTQPENIANGRLVPLNESLLFGSVVEYHCLPDYRLDGPFQRSCTHTGGWSGKVPRCLCECTGEWGYDLI